VKFRNDLKQSIKNITNSKPTCEQCQSNNIVKNGTRKNKSGTINRYLCKNCGHRFTDNQGFQKKRAEPEKIALALDLYYRGLSVRKVAEHFQQVHNLDVSHMTVYRWVEQYSRLASEWMNSQHVHTGERWHIDETIVKVNGEPRYLWNVLDNETRFLLATHVSKNRSLPNTRMPIKKAKQVTNDRPTEVFTDGMMAYPTAVIKELGKHRLGYKGFWSPHVRVPSIRAKESNNIIERLHGSEKERFKVMRGFDQDNGCATLSEGFRVHYNLIRDHQSLDATPGEVAGLPHIDGFRWLEVLRKSTKKLSPELLQAQSS
jgi:putative transposase